MPKSVFRPKNMINKGLMIIALLATTSINAQDVAPYAPGNTREGIVYYLPKTQIQVKVIANKVTYTPDKFLNIRHAYAISIHKSQGSEFPMVVMPIVNNFNRMLYNKLIYTAITRAKSSLILVGDRRCFVNGVRNDYVEGRKTTLKDFLINKYN